VAARMVFGARGISDRVAKARTGKTSREWYDVPGRWGMREKGHTLGVGEGSAERGAQRRCLVRMPCGQKGQRLTDVYNCGVGRIAGSFFQEEMQNEPTDR
jgi:hypothetical protein